MTPGHRLRRWVLWGAVVLAFALLSALLAGLAAQNADALDPDNPEDNGAQALARVLADQGVEVEVVRGLEALTSTPVAGATVVVGASGFLSAQSGAALREHTADAAHLVVLEPGPGIGEVLDLPVTARAFGLGAPVEPGCGSGPWQEGDRVVGASTLIEVTDRAADALVCLPPSAGFGAGGVLGGHWVEFPATSDRPRTVLLGIGEALMNGRVTEEANAATGLRVLGGSDRLVWYVANPLDAGDGPAQSLVDVLPDAFVPSVAVLLLALLALALVRGRRLGPVVPEPLPVVVRSIETTQSRARLYQAAGDRDRALASLQLAARRQWAARLGLPATTAPAEIVAAVVAATGRSTDEVTRVLADPRAPDDETLVRVARAARSLDEGNEQR
jgi:hypothetical protein